MNRILSESQCQQVVEALKSCKQGKDIETDTGIIENQWFDEGKVAAALATLNAAPIEPQAVQRAAGEVDQPVAWRAEWLDWYQYHDPTDPIPETWDSEPPLKITKLYAHPPLGEAPQLRHTIEAAHEYLRDSLKLPDDAPRRFDYYAQVIEDREAPQAGVPQGAWNGNVLQPQVPDDQLDDLWQRFGYPRLQLPLEFVITYTAALTKLRAIAPQADAQPDPFHVVVPANEAQTAEPCADPLYLDAIGVVREKGHASISAVQRYLRIGFNRAGQLIDRMEKDGLLEDRPDGTRRLKPASPLNGPATQSGLKLTESESDPARIATEGGK
jgi:DNA segregation ATPase FtsK/SpoIIIE-like protein